MISLPLVSSSDIQVESKVIFNTICAKCHEGECSGRLSFHLQKGAVEQHMLRHGGEVSLTRIRQLSELLRYMKEKCSFYPMSGGISQGGILDKNRLQKLKSPASNAYFLPLGFLEPGGYQLVLDGIEVDSDFCLEIINAEFDHFEKRMLKHPSGRIGMQFHVDEQSDFYLRITSQRPLNLNQLELLSIE